MSSKKIELGKKGEALVCDYLQKNGYSLLDKNFRGRHGEIDLILKKGDILSFVEVKSRKTKAFLRSELITLKKQKSLIQTAKKYLLEKGYSSSSFVFRFDVALVELKDLVESSIQYIPNAFYGV